MSCPVLSYLGLTCPVLSCSVLFCLALSCILPYFPVLSCIVLSCLALSCLVLPWPNLSCFVLSSRVLSCLVLSCPVLSFLVLSCPVSSCLVVSFRGVPAADAGRPDRYGDLDRKRQAPGAKGELAWGACVWEWSVSCLLLTGSVLGWTFSLSLLADAVNVVFGVLWRCLKYVEWLLRQSPHWHVVHFSVKMGSCRDRHVCLHLRGSLYLAFCRCRNDRL